MPYANLPKSQWAKMDRCVADVKAKNPKVNAYAVCFTSITGGGIKKAAKRRGGK